MSLKSATLLLRISKTGGSHKSKIVCTWFKNIPKLKGVRLAGVLVWTNKEIQRLGASYLTILWIFVRMHKLQGLVLLPHLKPPEKNNRALLKVNNFQKVPFKVYHFIKEFERNFYNITDFTPFLTTI